jgi:hypothetical protein
MPEVLHCNEKGIATGRVDDDESEPAGRLRPVWRFREENAKKFKLRE